MCCANPSLTISPTTRSITIKCWMYIISTDWTSAADTYGTLTRRIFSTNKSKHRTDTKKMLFRAARNFLTHHNQLLLSETKLMLLFHGLSRHYMIHRFLSPPNIRSRYFIDNSLKTQQISIHMIQHMSLVISIKRCRGLWDWKLWFLWRFG